MPRRGAEKLLALSCKTRGILGPSFVTLASTLKSVATGATSRVIPFHTGAIYISLAFLPKLAAFFTIMPKPVMGGALISKIGCYAVNANVKRIFDHQPQLDQLPIDMAENPVKKCTKMMTKVLKIRLDKPFLHSFLPGFLRGIHDYA